jgi:hypothetical protein
VQTGDDDDDDDARIEVRRVLGTLSRGTLPRGMRAR